MAINYNGNNVDNVIYNGQQVEKVIYNGNVVWESWISKTFNNYNFIYTLGTADGYISGQKEIINNIIFRDVTLNIGWSSLNTEVFAESVNTFKIYARRADTGADILVKSISKSNYNYSENNVLICDKKTYPNGFNRLRAEFTITHRAGYAKQLDYFMNFTSGEQKGSTTTRMTSPMMATIEEPIIEKEVIKI